MDQQPRHDRVSDGDPVDLASLQLGKKSSRVHDDAGDVTATHFLCISNVYQAIARVRRRVRMGGHDVPVTDIRGRFNAA